MIKITSLVRRSTGLSHSEWDGVIGWIETGMERWREKYGERDGERDMERKMMSGGGLHLRVTPTDLWYDTNSGA